MPDRDQPAGPAPATVAAFEARLAEAAPSLPPRLRQCAEHVAADPGRIAVSTVAEIARGAGVPPSAVMRFCRIMGFSGFSQMQQLFRGAYAPGLPDYATRLANLRASGAGSPSALLAEFVEAGHRSLASLVTTIDSRSLDRAVAVLASADTIHVIGLRRAYAVAAYLAYAFEKMEVPAILHDGAGQIDRRRTLGPRDALIAITFAPYSAETVELAEFAQTRGVPVVALTDTAMSPLRRLDATILSVAEADFGAFRALSATLSLAIALAVAVGAAHQTKSVAT